MAEMNVLADFLQKPLGKMGIISLLLYAFEENIDDDFICPCERVENIVTSLLYGVVPSIGSFFVSYRVMDSPDRSQYKCLYSVLTAVVWMVLCLIDGRYLTCALSGSEGKYTETDTLKWCMPSEDNATLLLESEYKTQVLMSKSQEIGFYVIVIMIGSFLLAGFRKCRTNTSTSEMEMS